jgi:hypothetical protein
MELEKKIVNRRFLAVLLFALLLLGVLVFNNSLLYMGLFFGFDVGLKSLGNFLVIVCLLKVWC